MSSEPGNHREDENYVLGRQLARGGMGSVMVAEDQKLGREVALKVMSLDAFSDDSLRRRFVREAHVLAQLAHPNIVPIYDLVWADGVPQFYTMKLVHGRTLQEILSGLLMEDEEICRIFGLDALLTIFLKVCDAVGFAHSQGVVHRDLKPANIMVAEFGEVLVMDWGLAGLMDDQEEGKITNPHEGPQVGQSSGMVGMSLTLEGAVMGTPRYMSPEQAAGAADKIGPRSDIFSLGGILYAILTLHPPVDGDSVEEVLNKLASGEILPPSGFASSVLGSKVTGEIREAKRVRSLPHCPGGRVPPALSAVAMHALALEPEDRYADTEAFSADVHAHMSGFATMAEEVGALGQLVLLMKRHRAMTAAIMMMVLLSAAFMVRLAVIAKAERVAAAAERRSAEIAKKTAYAATLAQVIELRSHQNFGRARSLLDSVEAERRGFDWRLADYFCRGDDVSSFQLGELPGGEAQCLDLLDGGATIALIAADGRLHRRNQSGAEMEVPRELPRLGKTGEFLRFYGLAFSPDGRRFAYGRGDTMWVVDAETFEVLDEDTSRAPQFAWLENDQLLFGFNGSVARPPFPEPGAWLIDFSGEKDVAGRFPRSGFPQMCAPLAVSSDRKHFVLHWVNTDPGSWERRLQVYPASARGSDAPIYQHKLRGADYPGVVALSRNAKFLAYTGGIYYFLGRSAHVVELSSDRVLFEQNFRSPIQELAFDAAERSLGLVGGEGVVALYDFMRGNPQDVRTFNDGGSLDFSEMVVGEFAAEPPTNFLTRYAQDERVRFFLGSEGRLFDLKIVEDGSMFTTSVDGKVRHWSSGQQKVRRPQNRIEFVETSYDRELPFATEDGRTVLFSRNLTAIVGEWDAVDVGQVETAVKVWHTPIALLRDGTLVTLGREGFVIQLWKKVGGRYTPLRTIPNPTKRLVGDGRARGGRLSEDQSRLVIAFPGQLISVDLATDHAITSLLSEQRTGEFGVASHDLSPDGRWIATSGFGPTVMIRRFENPDEVVTILGGSVRAFDTAVLFSRDGKRLYVGNEDGRVRVWNTQDWTEMSELGFVAHRGAVSALAVSRNSGLIATSGDETLKLFPVDPEVGIAGRRERVTVRLPQAANWIEFARDAAGEDRALLYSAPGCALEIWDTATTGTSWVDASTTRSSDLPKGVHEFGAIEMADGNVMVVGGQIPSRQAESLVVSDCSRLELESMTWQRMPAMIRARSFPMLNQLEDGRILVSGGRGRSGKWLKMCEVYDLAEKQWRQTGDLVEARHTGMSFVLADGSVLVMGGVDPVTGVPLTSCERYDLRLGVWTATGSLPEATELTSACVLADGRVLACFLEKSGGSACAWYDPSSGTWTASSALPFQHLLGSMVEFGEGWVMALASDRVGLGHFLKGCALLDPQSGEWQMVAPPRAVDRLTAISLARLADGRCAFIVAGTLPVQVGMDVYDLKSGKWVAAAQPPAGWSPHIRLLLRDGRLLLLGGSNEIGITRNVEIFDPER